MITSEELRVSALAASANRGKWVARRRIFWRWSSWIAWRYVLPVIGLLAVFSTLLGLAVWHYLGHDTAYLAAQKWVQHEYGIPQSNMANNNAQLSPSQSTHDSLTTLTNEATLHLHLDRHLTMKTAP